MGTPDELCYGNHAYAVKVRTAFREDCNEEDYDDRLDSGESNRDEERESFFEFLSSWGFGVQRGNS
jgi:hypothetical protein